MKIISFLQVCLFAALLLAGAYFLPWSKIAWGKIETLPAATISVTGEAQATQKNQIASFYLGVSSYQDDKQAAIDEVNTKIGAIIDACKDFGVKEEDIQTEQISIRENKQPIEILNTNQHEYQWSVSNHISVKIRDVERVSEFTDIMRNTGATNISGPNFSLDDAPQANDDLLTQAMADARKKAETIAAASNRKVGKVLSVSASNGYSGDFYALESAKALDSSVRTQVEPGSSVTYQNVSVVFELL